MIRGRQVGDELHVLGRASVRIVRRVVHEAPAQRARVHRGYG